MSVADPHALLARLLQERTEQPWLEFKQNNCNPELIGRCVAACANAAMLAEKDFAYIVFGIADRTKEKVGTTVRLLKLRKGGENFANWLNRNLEPRLMVDFVDFEEGGLQFAIIVIEPSYTRPVRFEHNAYIRVGENIKSLHEFPEQERALWLATSRHTFESAIALPHQSQDQVFEKLDVPIYFVLSGEELPHRKEEAISKLVKGGLLREDMEGGYDITNMGAILIAREVSIFPSIAAKTVRVIQYKGKDKRESLSEHQGKKGYAAGFSQLIQFLRKRMPTVEKYVDGVRSAVPIYPINAIREFLANALIHQDFTVTGAGPVVELYSDRIEISNPGNSLIAVDRIIDERRSRNEKLAGAMRNLGICEERGGGIDKAIVEIEEIGLPAPQFIPSEHSMRVVAFGPKKFSQLSKAEKIWACFCHCVIRWIRHDYMNNSSLRQRFSLDPENYQAVSTVISEARKAGRIVPAEEDQGNRNAKYVPYWAR